MLKNKKNSHEFSLYWFNASNVLGSTKKGETFEINDAHIYHRIDRVLRLKPDDVFTIFDQKSHIRAQLAALGPKNVLTVKIIERHSNVGHKPSITFFLPLLKRDAFEQAIYSLVELGANEIRLMITQKTQRKWGGAKEFDRVHNIIIAAAEQSKNYSLAKIYEPQPFGELIDMFADVAVPNKFFFDPDGKNLFPMLETLGSLKQGTVFLMVGPEGDLAIDEKKALQEKQFQFCRLTPTILRSQQAVIVSLGIFRSLVW